MHRFVQTVVVVSHSCCVELSAAIHSTDIWNSFVNGLKSVVSGDAKSLCIRFTNSFYNLYIFHHNLTDSDCIIRILFSLLWCTVNMNILMKYIFSSLSPCPCACLPCHKDAKRNGKCHLENWKSYMMKDSSSVYFSKCHFNLFSYLHWVYTRTFKKILLKS